MPSCSPTSALAAWPVSRLAEQVLVVPVAETDVAAVTTEVANGAGVWRQGRAGDVAMQLSAELYSQIIKDLVSDGLGEFGRQQRRPQTGRIVHGKNYTARRQVGA